MIYILTIFLSIIRLFFSLSLYWEHKKGDLSSFNQVATFNGSNPEPGARGGHSTCILNSTHMVIYGGYGNVGYVCTTRDHLDDIWLYNIYDNSYEFVAGTKDICDRVEKCNMLDGQGNVTPMPRHGAWMFTSKESESIMIFYGAGCYHSQSRNDIWEYNFVKNEWRNIMGWKGWAGFNTEMENKITGVQRMGSRYRFAGVQLTNSEVYFHGGYGCSTTCDDCGSDYGASDDVWLFNFVSMNFTNKRLGKSNCERSVVANPNELLNTPGSRTSHLAWTQRQNSFYIFSGQNIFCYVNDLWKYNASSNVWSLERGPENSNFSYCKFYSDESKVSYYDSDSSKLIPGGRDDYSGWKSGDYIYINGGNGIKFNYMTGKLGDVWSYHIKSKLWSFENGSLDYVDHRTAKEPGTRLLGSCVSYTKFAVCFGGGASYPWYDKKHNDIYFYHYPVISYCNGLTNDDENVCSGHGRCEGEELCSCDDWYISTYCEIEDCYNGGQILLGECVCEIDSNYYGMKCLEEIKNAMYNSVDKEMILIDYVASQMNKDKVVFDKKCNLLVDNSDLLLGMNANCEWNEDVLEIRLGSNAAVTLSDEIRIKSLSKPTESTLLSIELFKPSWLKTNYMYLIIIGGSVICLIICIALIGCSLYFITVQKNLKKLKKIKDVDLIIQEQSVTKSDARLKINETLFEISYDQIKLLKRLGSGSGNEVNLYLAKWKDKKVVMKCFKSTDFLSQSNFDVFEKEVSLLSSVSHPNIVIFYGCSLKLPTIGIIMEYCSEGDVFVYINKLKQNGELFPLETKIRILFEVSDAMEYLHKRRIIHRDLKTRNIFLTGSLQSKIGDFGLSKMYREGTKNTVRIGTSNYMAPEITTGEKYGNKVDVFSFGIIIYEILFEKIAYSDTILDVAVEIAVARNPNIRPVIDKNHNFPQWIIDLMKSCYHFDPQQRPSFDQIYNRIRNDKKQLK